MRLKKIQRKCSIFISFLGNCIFVASKLQTPVLSNVKCRKLTCMKLSYCLGSSNFNAVLASYWFSGYWIYLEIAVNFFFSKLKENKRRKISFPSKGFWNQFHGNLLIYQYIRFCMMVFTVYLSVCVMVHCFVLSIARFSKIV